LNQQKNLKREKSNKKVTISETTEKVQAIPNQVKVVKHEAPVIKV